MTGAQEQGILGRSLSAEVEEQRTNISRLLDCFELNFPYSAEVDSWDRRFLVAIKGPTTLKTLQSCLMIVVSKVGWKEV